MARFFLLGSTSSYLFAFALGAGITVGFSASQAAQPMDPGPAKLSTATNAPPAMPSPDTLSRYGKILVPSDETEHPLKLKMPFPGVGELKVPSQDEMIMRDKLEQLAKLSDTEIRSQLSQWPAYGKMNLRDQGTMLQRIQDFRDYRTRVALQKSHDMGLITLTSDQKVHFEKEYWDKRLKMEHELAKQFDPILKEREQKLNDELFREFSAGSPGPIAQAPKPAQPGSASTNTPAKTSPSGTQPKPISSASTQ
jgi:hypothetical protein